jgi:hypothetical protein
VTGELGGEPNKSATRTTDVEIDRPAPADGWHAPPPPPPTRCPSSRRGGTRTRNDAAHRLQTRYRSHQRRSINKVLKGRESGISDLERLDRLALRSTPLPRVLHLRNLLPFAPPLRTQVFFGSALHTVCVLLRRDRGCMVPRSPGPTQATRSSSVCTASAIPRCNSERVLFVGGSEKRSSVDFCSIVVIFPVHGLDVQCLLAVDTEGNQ